MILIIDNYDSFTYNLYQEIGSLYENVLVKRNDKITIAEIEKLKPLGIIISPGPGYPKDSGITLEVIEHFHGRIPILGICLGHQAIGEVFGFQTVENTMVYHGKSCDIKIDNTNPLFLNLPQEITVGRYHSLILQETLQETKDKIEIIGETNLKEIMAISIKDSNTFGVQFHPESILTKDGKKIIYNFLKYVCQIEIQISIFEVDHSPLTEEKIALKKYISKVTQGLDLEEDEAFDAMEIISSNRATDSQIAAFITSLKIKGETSNEITGFVKKMREKAISLEGVSNSLDIVGTGGDHHNTFNISTTSALVLSSLGVNVLKHGNGSVSSTCGSSDLLKALGVNINTTPEESKKIFEKTQISFLFAPTYHQSMKYVGAPRKEIGIRTVFNILGPLLNPGKAENIVVGVYDEKLMEIYRDVLLNLNIKNALIVHGLDGLDEITLTTKTKYILIRGTKVSSGLIDPRDYGFELCTLEDIQGSTPSDNQEITLKILKGEKGSKRDIVLLNVAFSLYTYNMVDTITEGINLGKKSLDNQMGLRKLEELIKETQKVNKDDLR